MAIEETTLNPMTEETPVETNDAALVSDMENDTEVTTPAEAEESETTEEAAPAARRQPARENIESSRQSLGNELGGYFTSDITTSMPQTEQAREIDTLRAAMRNKTVCRACVQAVYPPNDDGHVAIDALYGNSTWVRFVAQDFLADTPRFAGIANDPDIKSRGQRWVQAARHYMNANISFVVMNIERDSNGHYIVYGSRSRARQAIRDSVFFGKNCNVKVGDYGKAEIVDCRPNRIWVEFCGVEVRLNNAALVAFQYLPDATEDERFQVGQSLYVAIQGIKVDKENRVVNDLVLSHAYIELMSTDVPEITDDIVGSSRLGRIIAERQNSYVAVFNGIRCRAIINKSANRSYVDLKIGDKVCVLVTRVLSGSAHMVMGSCFKI